MEVGQVALGGGCQQYHSPLTHVSLPLHLPAICSVKQAAQLMGTDRCRPGTLGLCCLDTQLDEHVQHTEDYARKFIYFLGWLKTLFYFFSLSGVNV